jgi:3-oxoadipate enol-lactonase
LAEHYQVVVFDNRGAGRTKDDGHSFAMDTLAKDTACLITSLGLKNPVILGHSMGGLIVQSMLRHHADLVGQAIILNSAAKLAARARMVLTGLYAARESNMSLADQVAVGLPWFYSNEFISKPDNIQFYIKMLENNPCPQSLVDQKRQLQAILSFDARAWLHELITPTLIVARRDDLIATESDAKVLVDNMLNAKFVTIDGAHALEDIKLINDTIRSQISS